MTKESEKARLAAANPDYPSDYSDYLDDCYDIETGNTRISYEEWKSDRKIDLEIAAKYDCKVENLDKYDSRIGASIRDLAKSNMEKWGEW